jgi:hypothetical protein
MQWLKDNWHIPVAIVLAFGAGVLCLTFCVFCVLLFLWLPFAWFQAVSW